MGFVPFQPARRSSGPFEFEDMDPTSAVTLTLGEPLQRNASDPEQVEAHAGTSTVTGIIGVAAGKVTSGTPAIGNRISVARANLDTDFMGLIVNVTTVVTPVVATHEGVEYGMLEVSNNWYIDVNDVTDKVLRVTKVFPGLNFVLFRWISSAIGA